MPNLRSLGCEGCKAAPNMFRAVILIDSKPYQIDGDVKTLDAARTLCIQAQRSDSDSFVIFNDKGLKVG